MQANIEQLLKVAKVKQIAAFIKCEQQWDFSDNLSDTICSNVGTAICLMRPLWPDSYLGTLK